MKKNSGTLSTVPGTFNGKLLEAEESGACGGEAQPGYYLPRVKADSNGSQIVVNEGV